MTLSYRGAPPQKTASSAAPGRELSGKDDIVTAPAPIPSLDGVLSRFAHALESTTEAVMISGPTGTIEYVNPAFEWITGLRLADIVDARPEVLGTIGPEARSAMRSVADDRLPWSGDLTFERVDGSTVRLAASLSPVIAPDGSIEGFVSVLRDVTAERAVEADRLRLGAAVEQTSDSVVITDLSGTIEYVNPAFERISGYTREEVLGRNPRILKSGRQSAAFYRSLWRRLASGQSWSGTLINRRKDGTEYEEEATISPIVEDGETTGYIAVKRDVTLLHIVESALAREVRERAQIRASLARLEPRATAEATGQEIIDELLAVSGVDVAAIFDFVEGGVVRTLASGGRDGQPATPGRNLPTPRAEYLRGRAELGPWGEMWRQRPEDGAYGQAMSDVGIRAIAYAPIRSGGLLLGLVAAGTCDEEFVRHLVDHLPIVGEFGTAASALLARDLERAHDDDAVRRRIYRLLADAAFSPVFQPIVELASGERVGWEALTRFADGTPPEWMFAEAHAVGLGVELEVACVAAAVEAGSGLPGDGWLSVNLSPAALLGGARLRDVVRRWPRPLVVEITEHVEVENYAAIRRAVAFLGPSVRVAVDDAGSGFASFRHVLELGPRYVKLDQGLVQAVHRDPARQAMLFGLAAFAARVGCELVAEGIEEAAELNALRELGITLGQGFLLGRPEAAGAAFAN